MKVRAQFRRSQVSYALDAETSFGADILFHAMWLLVLANPTCRADVSDGIR